jgi:hypothetical protein
MLSNGGAEWQHLATPVLPAAELCCFDYHALSSDLPSPSSVQMIRVRSTQNTGNSPVWESRNAMPKFLPESPGLPRGISADAWDKMLRWHTAPKTAQLYAVNPVDAVASQYPLALREQAIEAAREFRMPLMPQRPGATTTWQQALHTADPRSIVVAYPGRKRMQSNAAGLAHAGARDQYPGWVDVAAGRGVDGRQFDKVLLHELRHTLEGGGLGNNYSYGQYQDVRYPKSAARLSPRQNEYLGRTSEEAARFADGRARYAQHTGRLIADPDEAERAAEMILSNSRGTGEGFYPEERYFYKTARELDPLIRQHQNGLLQGLLSVPLVVGGMQDQPQSRPSPSY